MSFDPVTNFGYGTVLTAPSPAASGTSFVLNSGEGARFPAPATLGAFNLTVWPAGAVPTPDNAEIVRCTARSTDTFTITREQESTSARTIVVGDQVVLAMTKLTHDNLVGLADTQTLINKTLTSPKINEDVAVTATATEINRLDGFNQDRCSASNSGSQTLSTATDTILNLGAEDFDSNTMHDNATNNSRVTIKTTGYYLVSAYVIYAANASGIRSTQIKKTGGGSVRINTINAVSSGGTQVSLTTILYLVANDYLQINTYQSSGGNLDVTNANLTVVQLV